MRAVAERRARAVTVVGEAGLGKSRLLAEFERSWTGRPAGCCSAARTRAARCSPTACCATCCAATCRSATATLPRRRATSSSSALAPLFADEGEAPMHLLGHLIGLDFSASPHVEELLGDEAQFRARLRRRALCLRRLGDTRPVVVVLDDLHWADDGSMEFMRHLLRRNRDMPLLCLTLTRQTLFEQHADWTRGEPRHTRLDLKPLDQADSQELAEALLQRIARACPRRCARWSPTAPRATRSTWKSWSRC